MRCPGHFPVAPLGGGTEGSCHGLVGVGPGPEGWEDWDGWGGGGRGKRSEDWDSRDAWGYERGGYYAPGALPWCSFHLAVGRGVCTPPLLTCKLGHRKLARQPYVQPGPPLWVHVQLVPA